MKMSENDLKTAINLNMVLADFLKRKDITKTQFLTELGWSEANFNFYLKSEVRIGDKALSILCKHLECLQSDIRA
jgi:DNA-binding Xre family transcriptional regulator